jgi:hypothetical protein
LCCTPYGIFPMSNTRVEIQGWPSELGHMLTEVKLQAMPELYYEYKLAQAAMEALGWTWMRTDPEVFMLIREMSLSGNIFSIWTFERND